MPNKIEVVKATLNVSFGDDDTANAGAGIKLEIDDREDGLNEGETSFQPGDDAYFFMFVDTDKVDLITTTPITTAGGVTSQGSDSKDIDETISFSDSEEASLGYAPDGAVTMAWLGKAYVLDKKTHTLSHYSTLPERDGALLSIDGGKKVFGVLSATYSTTGSLWKLSGVPLDFPEAMIIATGTTKP